MVSLGLGPWRPLLVLAFWLHALAASCWNDESVLSKTISWSSMGDSQPFPCLFRWDLLLSESGQMLNPLTSTGRHPSLQNDQLWIPQKMGKHLPGPFDQRQPYILRNEYYTSLAPSADTPARNSGRILSQLISTEDTTQNFSRSQLQSLSSRPLSSSASYLRSTGVHLQYNKASVQAESSEEYTRFHPTDEYDNDRLIPEEIGSACQNTPVDILLSQHSVCRDSISPGIGNPIEARAFSASPYEPATTSGYSPGKSAAQGSCFGLLVGMIVAIVWL